MTLPFGGHDWVATQKGLRDFVLAGSGLTSQQVTWAQQQGAPRVAEPAISMRLEFVDHTGMDWVNTIDKHLTVGTLTISAVDTTLDQLAIATHGLVTGDGPLRIASTSTIPAGLAALTDYWAVVADSGHVSLADRFTRAMTTPTPVIVDIQSAGTGVITLTGTSDTVRAGQEIEFVARGRRKARLTLQCFTSAAVGLGMAVAVLNNVVSRRVLPSQRAILDAANIGILDVSKVHSINSHINNVIFEPRAYVEFELSLVSELSETGTIITRARITDQIVDPPVARYEPDDV